MNAIHNLVFELIFLLIIILLFLIEFFWEYKYYYNKKESLHKIQKIIRIVMWIIFICSNIMLIKFLFF